MLPRHFTHDTISSPRESPIRVGTTIGIRPIFPMRTQTMCDRHQAQLDHDHLIKTCPQPTSTTYLGSTCLRSLKGELLATPGRGTGRGTWPRGVSEPNVWSYS